MIRIAFFHGGTEFVPFPDPWQYRQTRRTIDTASPDLILWSHSHAAAPVSRFGKTIVAWGLGNWDLASPENNARTAISSRALCIQMHTGLAAQIQYRIRGLCRSDLQPGKKGILQFLGPEYSPNADALLSEDSLKKTHQHWPRIDAQTWLPQTLAAFRWRINRYGLRSILKELTRFAVSRRAHRALLQRFVGIPRKHESPFINWQGPLEK